MWIIGDGGSPERAPSDTLESCAIAVSEWADGILVRVWATLDGQLVLSPSPVLPSANGEIEIEKTTREDLVSRPPVSPVTGQPYRLTSLEEFLVYLSLTPVRGFLEPAGQVGEKTPHAERFWESVRSASPRLPLHLVLSPQNPLPDGISPPFVWRRTHNEWPGSDRKKEQWILDSSLFSSGNSPALARFLITGAISPELVRRLHSIRGFWGVVTPTPYFTRKALAKATSGSDRT
ncbi:MAG: PI-PLC domain-containing protein [Leptospirillum sp.]